MGLTQAEADRLLQMEKRFVTNEPLELTQTLAMDFTRSLVSMDRREQFSLKVWRSPDIYVRVTYNTTARSSIVLARLDINGRRHRNPPSLDQPEGEWLTGTHLHIYREGLGDRFALREEELPQRGFVLPLDLTGGFRSFLRLCGVVAVPQIQLGV